VTAGEPAALLVSLRARDACEVRLRDELAILATMSRADAGCLRYDVLEELEEPGRFMLFEEWLDEDSLIDHNTQRHVARFVEKSDSMLAEPMRVQRLRRAA
jgi:quinol monooxygenase YgiN